MLQETNQTMTLGAASKVSRAVIVSLCIGLFSASAAEAGGIVTKWGFANDVGFSDALNRRAVPDSATIFTSNPNAQLGLDSRIDWPNAKDSGDATSTLAVGQAGFLGGGLDSGNGLGTGMVSTTSTGSQTFTPSVDFVHSNFTVPFPASDWLGSFRITDRLAITVLETDAPMPDPHIGMEIVLPELAFNAFFRETVNAGIDHDMDPMTPNVCDPIGVGGMPCADIFVLETDFTDDTSVMIVNGDVVIQQMFEFWDEGYNINIKLEGLTFLAPDVCSAALPAPVMTPCLGVITQEGMENVISASFGIECKDCEIEVPEPGALALFGAGLGALGLVRRRRKLVA